jgi:hypothetical protein
MSSNKLDEIVNDAYKKFFNPSKKNFKTKSVLINEVLNDNNLFKYDRTDELRNELSDSLFTDEVKLISATSNEIVLSRKNSDNDNKSLVNIYFYKSHENADNINDRINVNSINRFILYTNSGMLSFVTLPIINFDVEADKIKDKLLKFNEVAKILKKEKSSLFSVQITGNFYKTKDVKDVLKEIGDEEFEILLFELLYGLYHHQRKYPDLRLNFESLNSFLLYSKNPKDKNFNYFVNDNHFQVKDIGLKLKFHDLRNSIIHNDLDNNSLSKKQKKITQSEDLFNLINLFKPPSSKNIKKMIDKILKEIKKDNLTAESLLVSNSLFSKFKQSKPDIESSEDEDDVKSGVDVINSPLDTSSVGGYSNLDNLDTIQSELSLDGGKDNKKDSSDDDSDDSDGDDSDDDSGDSGDNVSNDNVNDDDGDIGDNVSDDNVNDDDGDIGDSDDNVNDGDVDDSDSGDTLTSLGGSSIDYSNEKDLKINKKKSIVNGNRKIHSGLTDKSDSFNMSLSISDSDSYRKKVKGKGKGKVNNNQNKVNRLGSLLGAENISQQNFGMRHNFIGNNSVSNLYDQGKINYDNDVYSPLSPASIPDVNTNLGNTMSKIRNSQNSKNSMQLNYNQDFNNFNSKAPMNSVQGLPMNSVQGLPMNSVQGLPMNSVQGLPMNNSVQGLPMNNVPGLPMNNVPGLPMNNVPRLPMNNGLPVNGEEVLSMDDVEALPMNGMQGLPMNGMQGLPMNGMQGLPMNGMQGLPMNGMQNNMVNQIDLDQVKNKYGENYNGPIDMYGGGENNVDLKYCLDNNISKKKKKNH